MLVKEDDFFDHLFMKYQMRYPGNNPDFQWLVCVPGFVVVSRLERIMSDLDFI